MFKVLISSLFPQMFSTIVEFYGDILYSNESDNYYITYKDSLTGDVEYMYLYEIEDDTYVFGRIEIH